MSQRSHSILLLPSPPSSVSSASLSAAYRPAITAVMAILKNLSATTQLLVVIPLPNFQRHRKAPRSEIYDSAQKLLGGLYSLICIVCAKLGVDVEARIPGSVDARILLLNYDPSQPKDVEESSYDPAATGPIIDLTTLASTRRNWNIIFTVDGEEGQALLAHYTNIASKITPPITGRIETVPGGLSLMHNYAEPGQQEGHVSSAPHHVVAVGGTFDHLHAGHKLLLTATVLLLQPKSSSSQTPGRIIVGITGDALLRNKKYPEYLGSWKKRQEDVVDFLLSILFFTRLNRNEAISTRVFHEPVVNGHAIHTKLVAPSITIECVEIQDPFGPTITDQSVTALVVSGETRSGGQAVNEKRLEKGWNALQVYEVDVLDAQDVEKDGTKVDDFSSKISSTEIRKREAETAHTSAL